jgi:hypothetical protein
MANPEHLKSSIQAVESAMLVHNTGSNSQGGTPTDAKQANTSGLSRAIGMETPRSSKSASRRLRSLRVLRARLVAPRTRAALFSLM